MARGITTDLIDGAKEMVAELCTDVGSLRSPTSRTPTSGSR